MIKKSNFSSIHKITVSFCLFYCYNFRSYHIYEHIQIYPIRIKYLYIILQNTNKPEKFFVCISI